MWIYLILFLLLCLAVYLYSGIRDFEYGQSEFSSRRTDENDLFFKSSFGYWLFTRSWPPAESKPPLALIFLYHGLGEHSGRTSYSALATSLTRQGFAVFVIDHHGHGKSDGARGYINDFRKTVKDCRDHIVSIAENFPGVPRFVIGISFGGGIAMALNAEFPKEVDGTVGVGAVTAFHLYPKIPPMARKMLRLSSLYLPRLVLKGTAPDPKELSRVPAVQESFRSDPLCCHHGLPLRSLGMLDEMGRYLESKSRDLKFPVFLLHGESDTMIVSDHSKWFFDRISSKDRSIQIIEGAKHDLLEDFEGRNVIDAIVEWIEGRVLTATDRRRKIEADDEDDEEYLEMIKWTRRL